MIVHDVARGEVDSLPGEDKDAIRRVCASIEGGDRPDELRLRHGSYVKCPFCEGYERVTSRIRRR